MNFHFKRSTRLLIHSISRYSNWDPKDIKAELQQSGVYAREDEWKKFLYYALLALGLSFTVAGIIFFFAFNWAQLHKFVKLGIVQGILIAFTLLSLLLKTNATVKNLLLTAASITVGALFAVFGQIYQTGADAYDFFLGWTVFVLLWALASRFAILWLLLLVLINTTFILYTEQVSSSVNTVTLYAILFAFNSAVSISCEYGKISRPAVSIPKWFLRCISLAAVIFATISISIGFHDDFLPGGLFSLVLAIPLYFLAIRQSLIQKDVFNLCIIPLSIQIMIASLILKIDFDEPVMLLLTFLILGGVTAQIRMIISLSKKWNELP